MSSLEATKTDVDVLEAVGDRLVNERKFPHIFQWQLLVKSFSEEQRGRYESREGVGRKKRKKGRREYCRKMD